MQGDKIMKRGIRLAVFIAVGVFLLVALNAAAEKGADEGTVKGRLVAKGLRTPVGQAVVTMRDLATGREYRSAPTDESGRFEIAGVGEGRYRVEVESERGAVELQQSLFVKANEVADFNLDVAPDAVAPEWDVARGVYGVMETMCRPRGKPSPWKPPGKPPWVPGPPPWHPGPPPWHGGNPH
jgi:hypothetical protein